PGTLSQVERGVSTRFDYFLHSAEHRLCVRQVVRLSGQVDGNCRLSVEAKKSLGWGVKPIAISHGWAATNDSESREGAIEPSRLIPASDAKKGNGLPCIG